MSLAHLGHCLALSKDSGMSLISSRATKSTTSPRSLAAATFNLLSPRWPRTGALAPGASRAQRPALAVHVVAMALILLSCSRRSGWIRVRSSVFTFTAAVLAASTPRINLDSMMECPREGANEE